MSNAQAESHLLRDRTDDDCNEKTIMISNVQQKSLPIEKKSTSPLVLNASSNRNKKLSIMDLFI